MIVLASVSARGDVVAGLAAQHGSQRDDRTATLRAAYDDDALFDQLSGAARAKLEQLFGRKRDPKGQRPAALPHRHEDGGQSASMSIAPGAPGAPGAPAPLTAIAEPTVNNPAADTTPEDTQSSTTLVLGSGTSVISAFNDTGAVSVTSLHATGFARSTTSGASWIDNGSLPTSADGDAGDPVLARDRVSGTTYLSTLSFSNGRMQVFRSFDNGATFGPPVNATPGFGTTDLLDKEWMAVDNAAGPGQGTVFLLFRNFATSGGVSKPDGIYLTRSTDGGATWGPSGGSPVTISNNVQGAWVTVGPDHAVYAFWLDFFSLPERILVSKSTDFGVTFGSAVTVATLTTTGANGDLGLDGGFLTNAFPQAVVNPVSGNLYVVYNDHGDGLDRSNIYVTASSDGGAIWGTPSRLDDDSPVSARDQFMPTLAVTPDGSHLFAAWYDRRLDSRNALIERWGVIITLSGTPAIGPNFRISSASFPVVVGQDPVISSSYMGDYDQAVADNSFFYTTWADNRLADTAHSHQPDVRFAKVPVAGPGGILAAFAATPLDTRTCNTFLVQLANVGTSTVSGITATLSTTVPGVVIDSATSAYPPIAPEDVGVNSSPFRIHFASAFACATNVDFTLTVGTAADGSFSLPVRPSLTLASPAQFDNTTITPLPDLATTESPIAVSGISGLIGKVTVSLYLAHTFDRDLKISLVSPDSTVVELSTHNGESGDDYGTSCSNRTTFDDTFRTSIKSGTAPFAGTWHPEGSLSSLIGKSGSAVNGTWKLRISDDAAADIGTLFCWSLVISPAVCTKGGCIDDERRATDFDGDVKADITVYRPSTGGWHTLNSSTSYSTSTSHSWGLSTDTPVPGDYDGDGKTDPAIYRPSTGLWAFLKSSTSYTTSSTVSWGLSTDLPVPGDYDGDGKTDPAIYRPSTGLWAILRSSTSYTTSFTESWGLSTDVPMQGDYDGDGKTDPAIFRPSTGLWAVLKSSTGYATSFTASWGLSTDIPVPGDYDGDGKIDPTVYRPSTGFWYILQSTTNFTTFASVPWGLSTDVPAPADYDGDGMTDPAIFRPSTGLWAVLKSSTNYGTSIVLSWGLSTDRPINRRP